MRHIVNISLPDSLNKEVSKAIESGQYSSRSEFFRDLLRIWKEEQLWQDVRASQRDIARGKGKVLKSLRDLR